MAWAGVPLEAAGASAGAPTDWAHPSARIMIARRVIAASLWGNPVIQPRQRLVVALFAVSIAGPGDRLVALLLAQPWVSPKLGQRRGPRRVVCGGQPGAATHHLGQAAARRGQDRDAGGQ